MADLTIFKPVERVVDVIAPGARKSKIGLAIKVVSLDDDRLQGIKRKILDRRLYLEQRGKTFKADEIDENKTAILYASVISWEWSADEDGTPTVFEGSVPELNPRNFAAVIKALPWIADQLWSEIGDSESFFDS